MRFEVFFPCDQLLPYVKHFVISENEEAISYTVMPDTNLVIGFQYRGRLAYINKEEESPLAASGVTGLRDTYRVFRNTSGVGSILVMFREHGASRFFKVPLHELFGESLSLEHFFDGVSVNELEERLIAAGDDQVRIALVEGFLIRYMQDRPTDSLVKGAIQYIEQSKGTIRMSDLASLLNTSASPLEKRFRREVGASPKKFATIVRARHVLDAMHKGKQGYAEYLSSFYDQAHFIKDFRKFAAVTPEQYLKHLK